MKEISVKLNRTCSIKDFDYVLTITGGGWVSVHNFIALDKQHNVFKVENYDTQTFGYDASFRGIYFENVDIDEEFTDENISSHKRGCGRGLDCYTLTLYKISNGKLKQLFSVDDIAENNDDFWGKIRHKIYIAEYNMNNSLNKLKS